MSVLASTHFIGFLENNFSHIFLGRFCAGLSHFNSTCPGFIQSLFQDAPFDASNRFTFLSRFEPGTALPQPSSPSPAGTAPRLGEAKKRRQEGRPPCRQRSQQQPHLLSA
jgi:hypothetical protein